MSIKLHFELCVLLQMLMDPMGGIVMTNDGNAILREVRCSYDGRMFEGMGHSRRL